MLAAILLNPATSEVLGKPSSAGSGKQWWEGEWIIPGVTHYLPEKPPEDIIPLRPRVEALKALPKRQVAGLLRSVTLLERKARVATDEPSIRQVTAQFRLLQARVLEAERRAGLMADDEDFLFIIQAALE